MMGLEGRLRVLTAELRSGAGTSASTTRYVARALGTGPRVFLRDAGVRNGSGSDRGEWFKSRVSNADPRSHFSAPELPAKMDT